MNRHFLLILLLLFLSGLSALAYEVFWLKELGLLFGNASYAMATTLAAFFLGLAIGSYQWGKRVGLSPNPLRLYGWLELGVAISAAGYFLILEGYGLIYPQLFIGFNNDRVAFTGVKFILAIMILSPPAYFMGGTLPVLSHYAVRQTSQLGHKVSLLYTANTLGAVFGVFLAGFYLPVVAGYQNSYLLIMLLTTAIALVTLFISRGKRRNVQQTRPIKPATISLPSELRNLAFLSGLLLLALQVLWGRMFAQVLQNSVYTFSIILMVFLFSLALGGALANRLMQIRMDSYLIMFGLLTSGALLVALTPFEFIWLTDNLHYIGSNEDWHIYLAQVTLKALLIMGPPIVLLGSVFPFLIRLSEKQGIIAGQTIGQLTAINTAGGLAGSLLAGFIILDHLGLWSGIRLIAVVYILAAWFWLDPIQHYRARYTLVPAMIILLMVSILDTSKIPLVKVDPVIDQESLLEALEGSSGTVAVIRREDHLKIKFNNFYTLGGTGSYSLEQFQGSLPLLVHTHPESVYVLGLGTGITAGASLSFPIKRLVVTEIVPEVITVSDRYFSRYTNSLFYDPRVTIIAEDGRNYLRGTNLFFDVIISDLFVPWKAGTGNLYALEHYQTVLQRLNKHGLFMQWLPTYQLSKTEFYIILHTMLEVFPQVTVWRGDFSALRPVIGLLGHKTAEPLPYQAGGFNNPDKKKNDAPLLAHYIGSLEPLRRQLQSIPVNTDDRPIIEFMAPITQRRVKSGILDWFVGEELFTFMQQLQTQLGSDLLSLQETHLLTLPKAGYHAHRAQFLKQSGKLTEAEQEMKFYRDLSSNSAKTITTR